MNSQVMVAKSGREYDEKVDIYSLGMVMYEFAALKEPFAEYDARFAGRPLNVFEQFVCDGLRPTIPSDAHCADLMMKVSLRLPSPSRVTFSYLFILSVLATRSLLSPISSGHRS
jgi:hypothetical protein